MLKTGRSTTDKEMVQPEFSFSTHRNVNWYNHFEKQFGKIY